MVSPEFTASSAAKQMLITLNISSLETKTFCSLFDKELTKDIKD